MNTKNITPIVSNYSGRNYAAEFAKLAMAHTSLLDFTTKEEYLVWVSDWKKAWKDNSLLLRAQKINQRWNHSRNAGGASEHFKWLTEQDKRLGEKSNVILNDPERMERLHRWKATMYKQGYLNTWYGQNEKYGHYYDADILNQYLLMVRKAGKIKAKTQRAIQTTVA